VTEDTAWLHRHAPELDNARAAMDWALGAAIGSGPAANAARLCAVSLAGSAALLWDRLSLQQEGARYLEQAEALIDAATPDASAARLLRQLGNLRHVADRPRALAPLQTAASLYERSGDQAGLGAVLALIGSIHVVSGAHDQATETLRRAQALLPAGRPKSQVNVLNNLGVLAALTGDFTAARDLFAQVLRIARRSGMRDREAMAQINLAEVDFHLGAYAQAAERTASAVEHLRLARQHSDLGWALVNLTSYRLFSDQLAEAQAAAAEALALVGPLGGLILRACIQNCALIGAMRGHIDAAARLAGWIEASYAAAGETRQPTEQRVDTELRDRLRSSLTAARIATLAEEGAAWSDEAAAAQAAALAACVA
jgi:tetratricopeptide (TPR) repeat protein